MIMREPAVQGSVLPHVGAVPRSSGSTSGEVSGDDGGVSPTLTEAEALTPLGVSVISALMPKVLKTDDASSAAGHRDDEPSSRTSRRIVVASGFIAGLCLFLDIRGVGVELPGRSAAGLAVGAAIMGALLAAFLVLLQRGVRALVAHVLGVDRGLIDAYRALDAWAYPAFLLLGAGALGARLSIPFAYVVIGTFVVAQVLVVLRALATQTGSKHGSFFDSSPWLAILFLLSGMAALVYEVVWQRVLFSVYGVNIESVTMVVALFMFGLGIGSLVGGALSRRFPLHVPWLFAACELGIGAFGAVSIPLITFVGARTLHLSPLAVGATVFALLLVPVVLMGATLPLLVQHLTRHDPNIGAVLGRLYSLNTLGAAVASLVTVDVLFVVLGRQATVLAAVALNVFVAVLVFRFAMRLRAKQVEPSCSPAVDTPAGETLPRWAVLLIAFVAGFISLSQEIVWMRPVSYATQGAPQVFGQILGVFLVGVAAGAWKAKQLCEAGLRDPVRRLGNNFVLAGAVYFLAMPLFGSAMVVSRGLGVPLAYLLVGVVAYLMGLVLPLLARLDGGSKSTAARGAGVSYVYAANVLGATAGPLLTGFVLLDHLTFAECALLVTMLTVGTGLVLRLCSRGAGARSHRAIAGALAVAATALLLYPSLYLQLPERLRDGPSYSALTPFSRVVQNRSGVLAVRPGEQGDKMYGGGIYDGTFNVNVVSNGNDVRRAFLIGALHPRPRRVLEIGLATGSWTWVLKSHEAVESITVVEINRGYEQIIQSYPLQREVLASPKVTLHYDDGRRWLMRNPEERFDFVLMNTTYHWRSNMTNLLSREFMLLVRAHLAPGGVLYFNTTRDEDAGRTAASVFEHVTGYATFIAASDHPFDMSVAERRENLLRFTRAGRSLYEQEGGEGMALLDTMASTDFSERAPAYRANPDLQVITDDNMLPEFKRIFADSAIGDLYRWHGPERSWGAVLEGQR